MDINHHIIKKYSSFDLKFVKDENEEYKYYIVLDGYIVGVQYNF